MSKSRRMSRYQLQLKALVIVLSLVSNDALRIESSQKDIRTLVPIRSAKEEWQTMNEGCSFRHLWKRGCHGTGCTLRKHPFDRSFNESCRLSDAYMFRDSGSQFKHIDIMADLLQEQSTIYMESCVSLPQKFNRFMRRGWSCARRAGIIMHAQGALVAAADKVGDIGKKAREKVSESIEKMMSVFGEDRELVQRLLDQMRASILIAAPNETLPVTSIKSAVLNLLKLWSHNETDKRDARDAIKHMTASGNLQIMAEDADLTKQAAQRVNQQQQNNEDIATSALEQISSSLTDLSLSDANSSAFVELVGNPLLGKSKKRGKFDAVQNVARIITFGMVIICVIGLYILAVPLIYRAWVHSALAGAISSMIAYVVVSIPLMMFKCGYKFIHCQQTGGWGALGKTAEVVLDKDVRNGVVGTATAIAD